MDRTDRGLLKHGGSCWPTSFNGDSMIKNRDLIHEYSGNAIVGLSAFVAHL